MKLLKNYIDYINKLSEKTGKIVAWLSTILVLLVCYDVAQRYIFKTTTVAFLDAEKYLFAIMFLMGASYTLKHNAHVRVDVFYAKAVPKSRAWIDFLGGVLFLVPFCLMMIYVGVKYTLVSWGYNEGSPEPGGLPARYIIKSFIPISFSFLFLQATAFVFTALLAILGEKNKKGEDYYA